VALTTDVNDRFRSFQLVYENSFGNFIIFNLPATKIASAQMIKITLRSKKM